MIERLDNNAKEFQANLNFILQYLPNLQLTRINTAYHQAPISFQIWIWDKLLIGGIIKGVIGTAIGLHNTQKLNKLKDWLEKCKAQQAQLVLITFKTSKKLNHAVELSKLLKNLSLLSLFPLQPFFHFDGTWHHLVQPGQQLPPDHACPKGS